MAHPQHPSSTPAHAQSRAPASPATHAWRLTFTRDGAAFTLTSAQRLAKRVPPGPPRTTQQAGRFIEVRDANQVVLYRRGISGLLGDTVEFRTADAARPLARTAGPRQRDVAVLVPDLPGARTVAIVQAGRTTQGDAAGARHAAAAVSDLVAVDLPARGETP